MRIEVEQRDGVCVVRFIGRFATGEDPHFLSAKAEEIKKANRGKLLADFSEVPYVGSTGLGYLVSIYTSVTALSGGRFVLVGLTPRVRELFDMTRLNTIIPMAADFTAGWAALCGEGAAAQADTP